MRPTTVYVKREWDVRLGRFSGILYSSVYTKSKYGVQGWVRKKLEAAARDEIFKASEVGIQMQSNAKYFSEFSVIQCGGKIMFIGEKK